MAVRALLAMKPGLALATAWVAIGGGVLSAQQPTGAASPPVSVVAAEARARAIADGLRACAARVAALPEGRAALRGDRGALPRLFLALDAARSCDASRPALALRPGALTTLAWSGRIGDLGAVPGAPGGEGLVVNAGSLSTTFVAYASVTEASGRFLGFATAERTVSVRRRIQNEFLRDFDLVAAGDPVELRYIDFRDADDPAVVTSLEPDEVLLRSAAGKPIAAARATATPSEQGAVRWGEARRLALAGALVVILFAWMARLASRKEYLGIAGLVILLRGVLLLVPAAPSAYGPWLSADVYASLPSGPWSPLGLLLDSPIALLATALAAFAVVALAASRVMASAPRPSSWAKALAADVLVLPILGLVFLCIGDTTRNCSLDIESISPLPKTPGHLVMQWSVLLVLASGALLMAMVFHWGGAIGRGRRGWLARLLQWALIGALAARLWPRDIVGLPFVPAVALYVLTGLLGASREDARPRWPWPAAGGRAGFVLGAVGVLSLLLHPTLMHFAEKSVRNQIEHEYASAVLRQPEWRERVLARTQRQIDGLDLLEDVPPGPGPPPLVDELAFATWSGTDLAAYGFSSAVEVQDPSGTVISRFALNLPVIPGPDKPLPAGEAWQAGAERLSLASAERRVLHARRLLVYHGRTHGAVHVYVGMDFWNLPFLSARDPYSILYRTGARARSRDRPVELVAFGRNRDLVFTSAEHAPTFDAALFERSATGPFWTTLLEPDGAQHTFVFSDRAGVYGLGYARVGPGRFAAQLVEAVTGMVLSAAAGLFLVVLLRTVMARKTLSWSSMARAIRERFALRLFVTFIAVAVVPVVVLELVVRSVVADRLRRDAENHALERAAIARKVVEDFALFQRGEAAGPPTGHRLGPRLGRQRNPQRPRRLREGPPPGLEQARAVRVGTPASSGLRSRLQDHRPRGADLRRRPGEDRRFLVHGRLRSGAAGRGGNGHSVDTPGPQAARGRGRSRRPGSRDTPHVDTVRVRRGGPGPVDGPSDLGAGPGPDRSRPEDRPRRARGASVHDEPGRVPAPRGVLQPDGGRPGAPACRPRALQSPRGVGGDGPAGRPRGQEPPDPHPALRRAPAARLLRRRASTSARPSRRAPRRSWPRCGSSA